MLKRKPSEWGQTLFSGVQWQDKGQQRQTGIQQVPHKQEEELLRTASERIFGKEELTLPALDQTSIIWLNLPTNFKTVYMYIFFFKCMNIVYYFCSCYLLLFNNVYMERCIIKAHRYDSSQICFLPLLNIHLKAEPK